MDIEDVLKKHQMWLDGEDGGERARLTGADLTRARLDFSSWPLWCGSLNVKLCDKLQSQLLYHIISVCKSVEFSQAQKDFANSFHRVISGEVPKL